MQTRFIDPSVQFVIGVAYGTLSGRALVVRVSDVQERGSGVHQHAHGVMDRALTVRNVSLPPDWALQNPDDHGDVLRDAIPKAVASSGISAAQVIGIGTDFAACTVLPSLSDSTPLSRREQLRRRPHAYAKR